MSGKTVARGPASGAKASPELFAALRNRYIDPLERNLAWLE